MTDLRFVPAGDRAFVVELGDGISPELNRKVHSLCRAIEKLGMAGVLDLVPTYRSILINYDPLTLPPDELEERVRELTQDLDETPTAASRVVELPTSYGGDHGPDLGYVAGHNGLTEDEVIALHSSTDYPVYMMGFTPGFTYLGGMSEKIATPRLQTPRTAIPAGSVGIAERQTGVYPIESPGGWQLIGRTPVRLFDPSKRPPVIAEPGDYIRFVPVSTDEYLRILEEVGNGVYKAASYPAGQT